MKINKIRFKNINSLRGETLVDFTQAPLKDAGLFAITGATGSGKTTLLDVISLALYNRIPRMDERVSKSFIEKSGAILTHTTSDALAEVEYECAKGIFTSQWSISTARTGKLRDYEMEIGDANGQLLDIKKGDIPSKNEELIGLSYEQFVRSIMLAQGDFSRFLKSSKDERGKLLEQITGSWIYRELGKKAYEINKEVNKELETLQQTDNSIREKLLNDEDFIALKQQLQNDEQVLVGIEKDKRELENALNIKEEVRRLHSKLNAVGQKMEEEGRKLLDFESNYGAVLQKHLPLIPLQDELREWKNTKSRLSTHLIKEDDYKRQIENAAAVLLETKKAIETLVKHESENESLITALDSLEASLDELQKGLNELSAKYNGTFQLAENLSSGSELTVDKKAPERTAEELRIKLLKSREEFDLIKSEFADEQVQNPAKAIIEVKNGLKLAEKWKNDFDWETHHKKELKGLELSINNAKEKLKDLPTNVLSAERETEKLGLELENLRKDHTIRQLSASLDEHRQKLQAGKPCPLCGALEHPFADGAHLHTDDIDLQIRRKNQEHDRAKGQFIQLKAEAGLLEGNIQKEEAERHKLVKEIQDRKTSIVSVKSQLSKEYEHAHPTDLCERFEQQILGLENLASLSNQLSKLRELKPQIDILIQLKEEGKALKQEKDRLYSGDGHKFECRKLRESWHAAIQAQKHTDEAYQSWKKEGDEIKLLFSDQAAKLIAPLSKLGYYNAEEAIPHVLSGAKYEELKSERDRINSAINTINTEQKGIAEQLEEKKALDSEKTSEMLNEALQLLESGFRETKQRRDHAFAKKSVQDDCIKQMEDIAAKMKIREKDNKKWMLLNEYIGDATGKKFSTFAQELTLQQLVALANKRLLSLTERYQLDIPDEGEDDSLVIVDQDMGAMRRSVKTLSGGESFLISLALALALSDLASRNVEIESLFIDEGFGTLDPETLDNTLDTLERLQAESAKKIGIISHVDALKERISTQIVVSKNGQGYSSLRVK